MAMANLTDVVGPDVPANGSIFEDYWGGTTLGATAASNDSLPMTPFLFIGLSEELVQLIIMVLTAVLLAMVILATVIGESVQLPCT